MWFITLHRMPIHTHTYAQEGGGGPNGGVVFRGGTSIKGGWELCEVRLWM